MKIAENGWLKPAWLRPEPQRLSPSKAPRHYRGQMGETAGAGSALLNFLLLLGAIAVPVVIGVVLVGKKKAAPGGNGLPAPEPIPPDQSLPPAPVPGEIPLDVEIDAEQADTGTRQMRSVDDEQIYKVHFTNLLPRTLTFYAGLLPGFGPSVGYQQHPWWTPREGGRLLLTIPAAQTVTAWLPAIPMKEMFKVLEEEGALGAQPAPSANYMMQVEIFRQPMDPQPWMQSKPLNFDYYGYVPPPPTMGT